MKKEIILFHFKEKKLFLKKEDINILKKNYYKIVLYSNPHQAKFTKYEYDSKKLNKIKDDYEKIGINLTLKKIYEINFFLKKIKNKNKNKKIYVSPYFISSTILEEEFIFYEVSKIYKIQFIRPELSFVKNRYLLAKNIFKQPYNLKKKTTFSKKEFVTLKNNYIASIEAFQKNTIKLKNLNFYIYKIFINTFNFLLNFRFSKGSKKYALVILNNNTHLNSLSKSINLKHFIERFFNKFNYELVFLFHPRTDVIKYFLKEFKKKIFFLKEIQ